MSHLPVCSVSVSVSVTVCSASVSVSMSVSVRSVCVSFVKIMLSQVKWCVCLFVCVKERVSH